MLVRIEKMRQFHTFEFSFREMLASFYPFLGHSSANSFIFEKIKVSKTKKTNRRGLEGGGGWCSPWTLVLCGCLCNTIILLIQYYCKGSHRGHSTNSPRTLVLVLLPLQYYYITNTRLLHTWSCFPSVMLKNGFVIFDFCI